MPFIDFGARHRGSSAQSIAASPEKACVRRLCLQFSDKQMNSCPEDPNGVAASGKLFLRREFLRFAAALRLPAKALLFRVQTFSSLFLPLTLPRCYVPESAGPFAFPPTGRSSGESRRTCREHSGRLSRIGPAFRGGESQWPDNSMHVTVAISPDRRVESPRSILPNSTTGMNVNLPILGESCLE